METGVPSLLPSRLKTGMDGRDSPKDYIQNPAFAGFWM